MQLAVILIILIIYFIASEWKSFMFFYLPATLYGILGDKYYIHALLIIKAMRTLLAVEISQTCMSLAEKTDEVL